MKTMLQWLPNFFGSNTNDIYLYTTPQYEQKFRSLRGDNKLTLTIDTHFASPFDVPPLKGKEDLYRKILKKDRAKSNGRSSIELYANRHAKPFFLYDAVSRLDRRLGKKYDFAFWSDAGCFRENLHVYTEWPSAGRLQEVWKDGGDVMSKTSPRENLIFIPTSRAPHPSMKFWTESMGPIDNDISIASFFGGMPHALDWFTRTYYAYHDHYLSLEIFIGKNQALINSLLFLFPERFITVWVNEPEQDASGTPPKRGSRRTTTRTVSFVGQCGENMRFYYEFWLAGSEERKMMQEVWMKRANGWRWWGWWKPVDKTPCKLRNVLGVETVLRNKLGSEWKPPGRMVDVPEGLV